MMVKGFIHAAESWHAKTTLPYGRVVDDVMIGLYDTNGGCEYEFKIAWERLCNSNTPKIEVYGEAWQGMMINHKDLLEFLHMSDNSLTPDQLIEFLKAKDYVDLTERVGPYVTES
jgi:hypothetical protein